MPERASSTMTGIKLSSAAASERSPACRLLAEVKPRRRLLTAAESRRCISVAASAATSLRRFIHASSYS